MAGGLEGVQATVDAHQGVLVFDLLAVHADPAHFVGKGFIPCEDGATVAVTAQGFGRKEGGAAHVGEAAGFQAMMGGAEALRAILDDRDIMLLGDGVNSGHVRALAIDGDRHDGAGVGG